MILSFPFMGLSQFALATSAHGLSSLGVGAGGGASLEEPGLDLEDGGAGSDDVFAAFFFAGALDFWRFDLGIVMKPEFWCMGLPSGAVLVRLRAAAEVERAVCWDC